MDVGKKIESLKLIIKQREQLEVVYKYKHKGDIYNRRSAYLMNKFKTLVKQLGYAGKDKINFWQAIVTLENKEIIIKVCYSNQISESDVTTLIELNTKGNVISIDKYAVVQTGEIIIQ